MWKRLTPLMIVLIVTLPYLPGLGNGFVWLDHTEIVDGQLRVTSATEALQLLSDDHNFKGYHRPVYDLLHSVNWALWGAKPFGFHLFSLLLHLANVLLVYYLSRRLGWSCVAGAFWAGLWGLHPVNTACVGLVHAQADLAVTFFLLIALGAGYSAAANAGRSAPLFALALFFFLLALLTKEVAFLFPLGLTLCAGELRARLPERGRRRFGYLLLFLWLAAVGVGLCRVLSLPDDTYQSSLGLGERLLTFCSVYVEYLQTLLVPRDLFVGDTVTRFTALPRGTQVGVLLAFALLIALQVMAAWAWPRMRKWIVVYNLALLPVAQIVPILHFRADRFLYLPSLALLGAALDAILSILSSPAHSRHTPRAWLRVSAAAGVGLAVAYAGAVRARLPNFKDDGTLFCAELARVPDYREGLFMRALHYERTGQPELAAPLYERCLTPAPGRLSFLDTGAALVNYARNLLQLQRAEDAYRFIHANLDALGPGAARRHFKYNLAVASYKLQRYKEALPLLAEYAAYDPADADCQYLLGMTAYQLHRTETAAGAFARYLELCPEAADRLEVERYLAAIGGTP